MKEIIKLFEQVIKNLYWIDLKVYFMNAKKWQWHFSFVHTMKLQKQINMVWMKWKQINKWTRWNQTNK